MSDLEKFLSSNQQPDKWENLLKRSRVIRDAVHEDIWVTDFETKVIDTPIFQRLRHIRQLGPTYLVYPAAQHTRFEHCVGTLQMAQKIMESIQRNYENKELVLRDFENKCAEKGFQFFSLDNRDIVLTRLGALLHDAAHIPFGHLLEKEGSLFKHSQWSDEKRVEYFFNECGIQQVITSYLKDIIGEVKAQEFVDELRRLLQAIEGVDPDTHRPISDEMPEDQAVGKLPHPYMGDIIGNTICADLLDYLLRDSYFTGLKLSNELRLVNNFALLGKTNKRNARVTLLLVRKGRIKLDALSGAVEFLRLRYYLAERVYYHRVKTAASAMIINSVMGYINTLPTSYDYKEFMEMGDDDLIYKLYKLDETNRALEANYDSALVRNLIIKYKNRELYKPVYMVYSRQEGLEAVKIKKLIDIYANPKERYDFQKYVENILGLSPGSIILYVTKKDLGKIARTRCLWIDGEVKPLDEIGEERNLLKEELETIRKKHEELWRLYVFMDRKLIEKYGKYVAGFCKQKFLEINDVEEEDFSNAKPLEDLEIFLDLHVPPDIAVSGRERELLFTRVKAIRSKDTKCKKLGIPIEDFKREFENIKKES